jgi:hypothetical protein
VGSKFLDEAALAALSVKEFRVRKPFPWLNAQVLKPDGFAVLARDFPPLSLFFWDEGRSGQHYQRPQNRYFLEYLPSQETQPGAARAEDLPDSWREFIDELASSATYRDFVVRRLGRDDFVIRYNWHVGIQGSEVCPHRDKDSKLGTHVFYFNTTQDWNSEWGGATIILGAPDSAVEGPDWEDFGSATPVVCRDNFSLFFKNGPRSWHGVQPLACPEGSSRRLFNVVFEHHAAHRSARRPLMKQLKRRLAQVLGS